MGATAGMRQPLEPDFWKCSIASRCNDPGAAWGMLALIRLGAVRYLDNFDHQYMIVDCDDQTPITGARGISSAP